jgi:PAS domain S-box-containing protein
MEPKLREHLSDIIDNSADAIITADLDGKVLSWNKGAEELYGYSAEEVIGRSILDLYPAELKKERQKWTKVLLEKGAVRNKRTRIYNRQGKLVDIILSLSLLTDEKGNPLATVGISKDISREVELEKTYRDLVETALDGINIVDVEGNFVLVNQEYCRMLGYSQGELIGKSFLITLPTGGRAEGMRLFRKSIREEVEPYTYEGKNIRKDGSIIDMQIKWNYVYRAGKVNGTMAIVRDITEHKNLEKKLKEHARQLEEKNKEVESFLYAISHDLKSPIISVEGYASTLVKEYGDKLDDEARFYLERIKKNTEIIDDLITDLLELSRVGRITQPYQEVDLGAVLEDLRCEYARRCKGLRIEIKALPRVRCEKNRIIQVFSNLIGNAAKYMGGQEKPLVKVGCDDQDEEWQFYVRDNGVGIPREYLGRVFQPFYRIPHEETKAVEGTGLGLAIVKKIVEYHKGEVWVESEVGRGSTFYFTLLK